MSDWFPSVVRIEKVEKHPFADKLVIVTVMVDYPVITNMVGLKVGDLIGYLNIDTIVPDTEEFHFLSPMQYERVEENGEVINKQIGRKYPVGSVPEKYRVIRAKKIRLVYSQGMLQPLPEGDWKEGDSLVDLLGLKKWEEDEEENVQLAKTKGRNTEKAPQGLVFTKYDIESLRKYSKCIREREEIVLNEKLHGSNSFFFHDGERLWCRSRNYFKKFDPQDLWWFVAIENDLENKLKNFPMLGFYAEIYGTIKGFPYDCKVENGKRIPRVRFFDVFNLKTYQYLDYDDRVAKIKEIGLEPVPELYRGVWKGKDDMYSYAEGKSTLNDKHIREGFVLNTVKERFEEKLQSRMILKLVGETYNLNK